MFAVFIFAVLCLGITVSIYFDGYDEQVELGEETDTFPLPPVI